MRRVVVTGLGLVTPLGGGVRFTWERLIAGRSGIGAIQSFDVSDLPSKIAGEVPLGETAEGGFNADDYVTLKERRRIDPFIVYGIAAAQQAVEDAEWQPEDEESLERTGVMIGSAMRISGAWGSYFIFKTEAPESANGSGRRILPVVLPDEIAQMVVIDAGPGKTRPFLPGLAVGLERPDALLLATLRHLGEVRRVVFAANDPVVHHGQALQW